MAETAVDVLMEEDAQKAANPFDLLTLQLMSISGANIDRLERHRRRPGVTVECWENKKSDSKEVFSVSFSSHAEQHRL